jgi:hypothetical protein
MKNVSIKNQGQPRATTSSMNAFLCLILAFLAAPTFAQRLNPEWKPELESALEQFSACQNSPGSTTCNNYLGESLKKVYRIDDFYSQESGRYLVATEIAAFLKKSDSWTVLGHSYEQKALTAAQEFANSKRAVVAVYMNDEGIGHVVVITPGHLVPSGSWGLSVPNVVSFFPSQPNKSFVDKGLSFDFGKNLMKDILIYGRNY